MMDELIREMVEAIVRISGDRYNPELIRAALQEYWEGRIVTVWSVEDVMNTARRHGYELSRTAALHILRTVEENHDAEEGINWSAIGHAVLDYIGDNKPGEQTWWRMEDES
jgi:hypothetical protein